MLDNENGAIRPVFTVPEIHSISRFGTGGRDLKPDEILVSILTIIAKAITVDQTARFITTNSKNPVQSAKALFSRLSKEGLISVAQKTLKPIPPPTMPVFAAIQGDATKTDFGSLAWRLQKREQGLKPKLCKVAVATSKACSKFGGKVSLIKSNHLDHDLHVTETALACFDRGKWIREDYLHQHGFGDGLLPDALILTSAKQPNIVVEIGSATYHKTRLQSLTEQFTDEGYQFEIW